MSIDALENALDDDYRFRSSKIGPTDFDDVFHWEMGIKLNKRFTFIPVGSADRPTTLLSLTLVGEVSNWNQATH